MPFRTLGLMLIFSLLAFGCSSQPKRELKPELKTLIRESGLKLFELKLVSAREGKPNNYAADFRAKRRVKKKSKRKAKSELAELNARAMLAIEESQFCRTGFWVVEKDIYTPAPYLRGECNERASEADRAAFPNSISQW